MATQYPNFIDSSGSLPYLVNGVNRVVASDVNTIRDAIVAIQTTLGTSPQSTFANVDARLDNIESSIGTSAPTTASYLVLGTNPTLSNERVLTFDSAFSSVDGGASSPYTVSLSNTGVAAGTYSFSTITVDAKGRLTSAASTDPGWIVSGANIQTSLSGNVGVGVVATSKLDIDGDFNLRGMSAPSVAASGQARMYFDSTTKKLRLSEDGYSYRDLGALGGSGTPNKFAVWAVDGSISADADFSVDTTLNYIGLGATATQLFNARKDIAAPALIRVTNTDTNGSAGLEVTGDASAATSGKLLYVADPLFGDNYVTLLGNGLPVIVDATDGSTVNLRSINALSESASLSMSPYEATLRSSVSASISSAYGTWGKQLLHVGGNLSVTPRTGQDGSFLEHSDEFALSAVGPKMGIFVGNESNAQIIFGAINQSLSSTAEYSAKYGNPANYSALGIFHRNGTEDSLGGSLSVGGIANKRGLNVGGIYLEGDDITYGDGGAETPAIRSVIESEGPLAITTRAESLILNAQSSVLGSGSLDSKILFTFGGRGSLGAGERYSDLFDETSSKELMRLNSNGRVRLGLNPTNLDPAYDIEVAHDVMSFSNSSGSVLRTETGPMIIGTISNSDLHIITGIGDGASYNPGKIIFGTQMSYADANNASDYGLEESWAKFENGHFSVGFPTLGSPQSKVLDVISPANLTLNLSKFLGTVAPVTGSRATNIAGIDVALTNTGNNISGGTGVVSGIRSVVTSDANGGSDVALLNGIFSSLTGSGLLAANAYGNAVGGNSAINGTMTSSKGTGFTAVASALTGKISGGANYNVGVATHSVGPTAGFGLGGNVTSTGSATTSPIGLLAQTATLDTDTVLSNLTSAHKAAITGIAYGSDHTAMMTMWSDTTQKLRLDLNGLAVANGSGGPAYSFINQPNTGIGSFGTGYIRTQFFPTGASVAAQTVSCGAKLQTTTASTTSFGINFGTSSNTGHMIKAKFTVFCSSGTQVGKTACFNVINTAKNVSGTLTIGTPSVTSVIDAGLTCSTSITTSGTNIVFNAVGQSGQTLNWTCVYEVIST